MLKKIILLFTIIFNLNSLAQSKFENSYLKYFEANRELPFLHLNKTTFVPGEEVWIKAYVINQKNQRLSDFTRNLYCIIYDESGELKTKKLLYVENGIAQGNFKIDSTFTKEKYFIKTATNWMRNFQEDFSFSQQITILNPNKLKSNKNNSASSTFDIQILPEGGNALANHNNNYGVIIKNPQNLGVKVKKGEVVNNEGEIVTTFSTNQFGLGSVSFYYEKNRTYSARFTLENDSVITKPIANPKNIGISLNVENKAAKFIRISVSTNEESSKIFNEKKLKLFIHNTNTFLERDISLHEEKTIHNLILSNNKLIKGINIITLFDEYYNPIAERLIYIHDSNLTETIKVKSIKTLKDSLSLSIQRTNSKTEAIFLSTSVLPSSSKAYQPKNSIISNFILKPYVKGDIQNPQYYFTNVNRKKLIDLDLLLLTQGWSKYEWNNIFNNPINYRYENENGISLKGQLNITKTKDSTKVFLISSENDVIMKEGLDKRAFQFNNLYLKKGTEVNFIAITEKKKHKTRGVINLKNQFKTPDFSAIKKGENLASQKTIAVNDLFDKKRIKLDAFSLKTKLAKPENKPFFLNSVNKRVKVIDENYSGTLDVFLFLRQLGYYIPLNFTSNQQEIAIYRTPSRSRVEGSLPIVVFLDNIILRQGLEILQDFRVTDFSEIHYAENEIFFYINSKGRPNTKSGKLLSYKLPLGFANVKNYYNPKYNTKSSAFLDYGAVYWNPDLKLNAKETQVNFNTPTLNQEEMTLYIEGITSSGKLISVKKRIN